MVRPHRAAPKDGWRSPLPDPQDPMTTVVVTKKNGVACIAADTLATYGDLREPADLVASSDKLVQVGEAWVAPTGPASAQLILGHHLRGLKETPQLRSADQIFDFLTQLQRSLRDDYYVLGKEDSQDDYESMRMELIIASPGGIFGAYPQRSVQEFRSFYAFGSGAEFALGAMSVAEASAPDAESLARVGVETAARFDVSTELPMTAQRIHLEAAR